MNTHATTALTLANTHLTAALAALDASHLDNADTTHLIFGLSQARLKVAAMAREAADGFDSNEDTHQPLPSTADLHAAALVLREHARDAEGDPSVGIWSDDSLAMTLNYLAALAERA